MLAKGSEKVTSDLLNYFADNLYDVIYGKSTSISKDRAESVTGGVKL